MAKVWKLSSIEKRISKNSNSWIILAILVFILITDRVRTLINFGFIYTDIDQTVLWNGAMDYSMGIFHEPFFYGQAYNYMLESFLAIPLLWLGIPVYISLPIVTSFISLIPFVILAIFLKKRDYNFWAYFCLAIPILLPLQYNFLTTISRGFVQAHLFIPFLFWPLFKPQRAKNVTILYISSAICLIANQSSAIIVIPIFLYVYTYHLKSRSFYLKSLLVIPVFILDLLAKYYYKIHPEKVLHAISELKIDGQTFLTSLKTTDHFEHLFPLFSNWGIIYPFLFIMLIIITIRKSQIKEFLFVTAILVILLITLSIPKIQQPYPNAGLFFNTSRLYLYLPLLLIISLFLIFKKIKYKSIFIYCLLVLSIITFITKNYRIQNTVEKTVSGVSFPIAKNQDLINRANALKVLALKYELDLIVHVNNGGWNYLFDSYAFNPLTQYSQMGGEIISVNLSGDRRTWLYPNSLQSKQILLNGIIINDTLLDSFEYEKINQSHIVIKNNKLVVNELFSKLDLKFGNSQ